MIGLLQKNLGLKLLALTLSALLWAFVKFTQTPFAPSISQAELKVPLEVATDAEMTALDVPDSVRVTVRGSEDAIHGLKADSVTANLDLHGKQQGMLMPEVKVITPPDLKVVGVTPDRVSIKLDPVETQTFPLEVKLQSKPANGFRADSPTVTPASVNVKGAHTYVSQVKHVVAQVNLSGLDTSVVQKVALVAVDEEGGSSSTVDLAPATATVSIQMVPEVVPKMLPVFPDLKGTAATLSLEPAWTPRFVRVIFRSGKNATVASLTTAPVDVSTLKPGLHKLDAHILLPPGATLVAGDPGDVHLSLKVADVKKSPAPARRPSSSK